MASQSLSEEQKRRMEENRKRALELRTQREQGKQGNAAQLKQGSILPVKQPCTKLNPVFKSSTNSGAINKSSLSGNVSSQYKPVSSGSGHSERFQSNGFNSVGQLPSSAQKTTELSSALTTTITTNSKLVKSQFSNQSKFSSQFGNLKGTSNTSSSTSSSPLKMSQFGGKNSQTSTNAILQVKGQNQSPFQNMKCITSHFYSKKLSQHETKQTVDFPSNNKTTSFSASSNGGHFVTFVPKDGKKQQPQQQRPLFLSKGGTACRFVLVSKSTFAVNTVYDQAVINVFKSMKTKQYGETSFFYYIVMYY